MRQHSMRFLLCLLISGAVFSAEHDAGYPCIPSLASGEISPTTSNCQSLLENLSADVKAYILVDYHSGQVLAEHNSDAVLPPASLSKMMTTYVLARALKDGHISLDDEVIASERAWRMEGSRSFIRVGQKVLLANALKGIIIQSGNDASVMLAEHLSGDEKAFANLMNHEATRLGMHNSRYSNSTGLPDAEEYTTARDLAKLARALIHDYPEVYAWHALREFTFNGIHQQNRNGLLALDPRVDGVKTGHTKEAGFNLVGSAVNSDGMRLITVVLGTGSVHQREHETRRLLKFGFANFVTHKLYTANQPIAQLRVWKGDKTGIDVGTTTDVYATLASMLTKEKKHFVKVELEQRRFAPLKAGEIVGTLRLLHDDAVLASVPLVSLASVNRGGWLHNLADTLRLLRR